MSSEYRYYVIVDKDFPRERPYALVRTSGTDTDTEEYFSPRLVWERNDLLERATRGSIDGEEVAIAEAEVEHYVEQLTRRFKEHEPHRHGWKS
jgi:hypothetical protein